LDVRTIEAERIEENLDFPVLPRDADVVFDYHGTKKTVQLKAGANAWDQAQAAQLAFGETLLCRPIEQMGDHYTIHVHRPSVFPITFVKGDERVRTWVDNTRAKVATEEARRLFGGKQSLKLLPEPGIVYQVKTSRSRLSKPRSKPESVTRQMTGPGIKSVLTIFGRKKRNTPVKHQGRIEHKATEAVTSR
jgi:hypothetical protein